MVVVYDQSEFPWLPVTKGTASTLLKQHRIVVSYGEIVGPFEVA
jgi:hypothetical protein